MKTLYILGILYLCWNILVFLFVAIDKLKAKMKWSRISEFFLLTSSFFMGSLGVALGMIAFHHKVSKGKFRWFVPIFMVLNIGVIVFYVYRLN